MFRVVIQKTENGKDGRSVDVVMKTEKMYELLGRFMRIYGPPMVVEETHGVIEYEYFNEQTKHSATVSLAKIAEANKEKKQKTQTSKWGRQRSYTPPPPPIPSEPDDERITEMLAKKVLEPAGYYYR